MTLTRLIKLGALVGLVSLPGCRTLVITKPVQLPTVARPTLVPVTAKDLQCLDNFTYTNIVNREGLLRKWGESESEIIRVNNEKAKDNHPL